MTHPTREELTLHLLGEAPADVRQRVAEHLPTCPACAAECRQWRTALRRLNHWRLRPPRPQIAWPAPLLRWATATALVLIAGFALGLAYAARSANDRQAAATDQLRAEVRESLRTLAERMATGRAADLQTVQEVLVRLEQRHRADYADLRKDLETVATLTEDEIRAARDQLRLLSSYSTDPPPTQP